MDGIKMGSGLAYDDRMRQAYDNQFMVPSTGQIKLIKKRLPRYWILYCSNDMANNQPWIRWYEETATRLGQVNTTTAGVKYVLDILELKVIHSKMTLRDLEMMNRRNWPLKEKMFEVRDGRDKAKKSKRNLAKFAKEMEG